MIANLKPTIKGLFPLDSNSEKKTFPKQGNAFYIGNKAVHINRCQSAGLLTTNLLYFAKILGKLHGRTVKKLYVCFQRPGTYEL